MVEPLPPELPDDDLSADTSRLDGSLLRYVLLNRSRLNMLVLDRELRSLVDLRGVVRLAPGTTRSNMRYRAEATMQLAIELALARPAVASWVGRDALRRQWATDAAYFASECWRTGENPQAQPGTFPDSPMPATQLSSVPATPAADTVSILSTEFWRYMLARTRLIEEHVTAQVDRESTGELKGATERSTAVDALNLQHLLSAAGLLQGIAARVVALLRDDMGADDWRRFSDECIRSGTLRRPPPEVFDALLTGDEALVAGPTLQSTWTIGPDGDRRSNGAESPIPNASELRSAVKRINEANSILGNVLELDAGVPPVVLLSDRLGVLPTTPAWPDVDRALRGLALADSEALQRERRQRSSLKSAGDSTQERLQFDLQTDMQVIRQFHSILDKHGGGLARAVCAGAFLGALGSHDVVQVARLRNVSMRRLGLERLAEGLRFRTTDAAGLKDKLDDLRLQLHTMVAQDGASETASPWPDSDDAPALADLGPEVQRSEMAAATLRNALYSIRSDGWNAARTRLVRYCRDGQNGDASLAELVCAVRHEGPARWITLDPARMTLAAWTRALFASLLLTDVPAWLGAIALQRLGVDSLSAAQQERLLRLLIDVEMRDAKSETSRSSGASDTVSLVDRSARLEGGWKSGGRSIGTALVIRAGNSTVSDSWYRPPSRGLVLLASADDLARVLLRVPNLFTALPKPHTTWREDMTLDERRFQWLRHWVDDVINRRGKVRLLYRHLRSLLLPPAGDGGTVVGMAGPDDLFGPGTADEWAG